MKNKFLMIGLITLLASGASYGIDNKPKKKKATTTTSNPKPKPVDHE